MHDIAQAAAEAAAVPEFKMIARRGRTRRRTRQATAMGVAVAVTVVAGLAQVLGSDGRMAPGPTDRPVTPTAPASVGDSLAAIVDAKNAQVLRLAATPGDPRRMATILRQTEDREVLALTDDGFATRTLLEVPIGSDVHALRGGKFVLVDGWQADRMRVLDPDGTSVTASVSDGEAPLAVDEVAIVTEQPPHLRIVGVDADGNAHPVPTPDGLVQVHEAGGRLQGVADVNREPWYHWSDDGGLTWASKNLGEAGAASLVSPAWSAAGADHAVVEGSDGATLFPLIALHTADGGAADNWARTPLQRDAESHWTVDGSWVQDEDGVRLQLTRWSTAETTRKGPLETGIYQFVDGVPGNVQVLLGDSALVMLAMDYDEGPIIWFAGPDQDHVVQTTDGGATWKLFPAR